MKSAVQSEDRPSYLLTDEEAVIAQAIAILESRHNKDGRESFNDPQAAGRFFRMKLDGREREYFAVAFLNNRHRLLAYEELHAGTIDGCEVHPRVIAKAALMNNAAAVIVAHNHPSGNPEPSAADRALTARLKQALALLEIRLLDHFVIGEAAPVSMAARGWV